MDERGKNFGNFKVIEFGIDITVEKGTRFVLYCTKCGKALYTFSSDNLVTRTVSQNQGLGHSVAFNPPHDVVVIDLSTKTAT